ncbi:SELO-like protein [Mya arenaria]|uniref:Selenoprotein O n=2 Tax=Mya arenaria TaxID=6604 RepID=A0ABY7DRE8_MYAAR|nr:protein adenylyltransferase SelO-like isoform X1 [Mya arenaria]WAQ99461.1 SELO-like protein [Mya arenaria]
MVDKNCSLLFFLLTHFLTIVLLFGHEKTHNYCMNYSNASVFMTVNNVCLNKPQWHLFDISQWIFSTSILKTHFPIDTDKKNFVREVRNVLFSEIKPEPLKRNPKLAAVSDQVLSDILNLDPDRALAQTDFLKFANGDLNVRNQILFAHRYGGHQFSHWAGQLGDGRAIMLGEYVNHLGERWELQLKGSGKTPYSRRGDGKAVIRSSVREFLCSEAMFALGIPTTRAASLVVSDDPVIRDQFYNGNIKKERAAVVLRLAPSWFRIGSLEILATHNEIDNLRSLVDFIIVNYFPFINASDPDRVLAFYQEIVEKTARMIALWQSVGFTHGVCNTDNFSILSLTIDYGPFGFMDNYDPQFVPNTSDDEGLYKYERQPDVGWFNLNKLRIALLPLMNKKQKKQADIILDGYSGIFKSKYMEIFLKKLGFVGMTTYTEDDEQFLAVLLKIMEDTKADFTMTFRELSEISLKDLNKYIKDTSLFPEYWTLPDLVNHSWFESWLNLYKQKLEDANISEIQRQSIMKKTNPRYILRNWIAQAVIEQTQKNNFEDIHSVLNILTNPFTYNKVAEQRGLAGPPPDWAGKLRVSCSS